LLYTTHEEVKTQINDRVIDNISTLARLGFFHSCSLVWILLSVLFSQNSRSQNIAHILPVFQTLLVPLFHGPLQSFLIYICTDICWHVKNAIWKIRKLHLKAGALHLRGACFELITEKLPLIRAVMLLRSQTVSMTSNTEGYCSGNILHLYLYGIRFESHPDCSLFWFNYLKATAEIGPPNRPRLFQSKSLLAHFQTSKCCMIYAVVTVSLNNIRCNQWPQYIGRFTPDCAPYFFCPHSSIFGQYSD